ncbi:uncharacterized protein PV09_00574 [Verruconis gallopava]|uniref:Vacuolar protein sorting-associated protein 28 n=1 Tax=Verruconis gallopava TaxID=253628 RepID=A0A0D1Z6N3_9PEZI|nr:uncharacterized protein PV09_00574 [Verruconis gallopava]KIW08617.1 hypothetical protein PV09_00574 [Verruconis gallopava]
MYPPQRQLAYAPTPYSYTPSSLSATINLDEEVKVASNNSERELYESLAELYSIIVTLDAIEKAYLKDSISEEDYAETCGRLLKQYKSHLQDENISKNFGDLETFMRKWDIECPRARERIRIGLVEQSTTRPAAASGSEANTALVMTATENFITLLDAIKIGMVEKDMLHPLLVDVIQSVNKVTDVEFDSKSEIVKWLIKLNQMGAAEKLSSEDQRQFQFDMDQAYKGFKKSI